MSDAPSPPLCFILSWSRPKSPRIPVTSSDLRPLSAFLHLVRPLGFELDDAKLKRAGLDYHEWARLQVHDDLQMALKATGAAPERCFAMTTRGSRAFAGAVLRPGDVFVFGRETAGLTPEQLQLFGPDQRLRLPMRPNQRSLNLSNAVAVTVFEAWRQAGYEGAA